MGQLSMVLASGSPRRRQLLRLLGLSFEVRPAEIEEEPKQGEKPTDFVQRTAREKALAIAGEESEYPVLGADTIVELNGDILGKPETPKDAERMLRLLSGHKHRVHTAMALAYGDFCPGLVDTTKVSFLPLSDRIIRWYVETGEPLDKAGAYGIQGLGGIIVSAVEGSPHTVVGLPIHRLPELFSAHNLDFWSFSKPDSLPTLSNSALDGRSEFCE